MDRRTIVSQRMRVLAVRARRLLAASSEARARCDFAGVERFSGQFKAVQKAVSASRRELQGLG
jgi:hypothetical protein